MRHCSRCGTAYPADERFCPLDGAPVVALAQARDPLVGQTLGGRYLLARPLGKGGMGAVYEGEHIGLGKRVAVKVLLDQFSEDREVLARFHQEARTASRVGHENIIDILDIGDHDGRSYIVMEYLDGRDLRRESLEVGAMPLARAAYILRQITRGLGAAHDKGVIHRDMKPENVFLTTKSGAPDFVKVMDFGISKIKAAHDSQVRLTQTGAVIGTPMYMAPEQGMGRTDIDHRADVYSVGVMTFELLCGRPPFQATTYLGLMTQHLQEPPPPPRSLRPDLPPALEQVVLRALEKDPARRWQSVREMGDAVAAAVGVEVVTPARTLVAGSGALQARPGEAPPPPAVPLSTPLSPSGRAVPAVPTSAVTLPRERKRRTLWLALVGVGLVGGGAAAAVALGGGGAADRAPELDRAGGAGDPRLSAGPAPGERAADAGAIVVERFGSLELDSQPRGALVVVDGVEQGHTPLVIEQIAAGKHRVRLLLPGYEPLDFDKTVRPATAETFVGALTKARKGSKTAAVAGAGGKVSAPLPAAPAAGPPDAGPAAVAPPVPPPKDGPETPPPPGDNVKKPPPPGDGGKPNPYKKSNPYTP